RLSSRPCSGTCSACAVWRELAAPSRARYTALLLHRHTVPRDQTMSDVIALVFDFDDTLAPDSTSGLLADMGVDVENFWKDQVGPLLFEQDWDPVPAYLYQMIALSRSSTHGPITRERLADWGRRLPLHTGVETLFSRLRAMVKSEHPQVQLEFHLISSG